MLCVCSFFFANLQVISPQEAVGVVEYVDDLHTVQEKTYAQPTVLLAGQVCLCDM